MKSKKDKGAESTPGARDSTFTDSRTEIIDVDGKTRPVAQDGGGGEGIEEGAPGRRAIEANVILIAHPDGKLLGTRVRMAPGSSFEIGRSTLADISIPKVISVSRRHARIHHSGREVFLEDLGSTNGTWVNDRLVRNRVELKSGDRFQVGAVHFKFLHELDIEAAYHDAIHQLVIKDGLTEIFNRRRFEEELVREFDRAVRYRRPLVLIFLDVDHFKRVNDAHGHLGGDAVLKELANVAGHELRRDQIFARIGGEEFAILSPETRAEGGAVLAERVRQRVAEHQFGYAGHSLAITCSFGVAEIRPEDRAGSDLLRAADQALYRAKQSGRNQVAVGRDENPD